MCYHILIRWTKRGAGAPPRDNNSGVVLAVKERSDNPIIDCSCLQTQERVTKRRLGKAGRCSFPSVFFFSRGEGVASSASFTALCTARELSLVEATEAIARVCSLYGRSAPHLRIDIEEESGSTVLPEIIIKKKGLPRLSMDLIIVRHAHMPRQRTIVEALKKKKSKRVTSRTEARRRVVQKTGTFGPTSLANVTDRGVVTAVASKGAVSNHVNTT